MFTTCGGSFQGIRLCPKLLKSYTINTYSLLSVSYTILKWLWKSADSWVPAWSVEASCGGCSEERKGVRVQAFPDSPEQSGDDHPRGPTAAASTVTSTGLQSTHRNYVSTSSIIPPGKVCRCHYFCFDIWNPFKSSRTSLENYWEVNSSRRQPVAQCLHRVVWPESSLVGLAELIQVSVTHGPCPARGFQATFGTHHHLILHLRTFRLKIFLADETKTCHVIQRSGQVMINFPESQGQGVEIWPSGDSSSISNKLQGQAKC